MLNITFLPMKRAPGNIKPVTYHVNQWSNTAAVAIAREVFKEEHGHLVRYYDNVAISNTRILG